MLSEITVSDIVQKVSLEDKKKKAVCGFSSFISIPFSPVCVLNESHFEIVGFENWKSGFDIH